LSNDCFRRLLDESKHRSALVDKAFGAYSAQELLGSIDLIDRYKKQITSAIGIESINSSSMQAAISAVSGLSLFANEEVRRHLIDQQSLINQVREVWPGQIKQPVPAAIAFVEQQKLLMSSGVDTFLDTVNPYADIKSSLANALQLTKGIDVDALLGLKADLLLQQIDPIKDHLKKLEESFLQFKPPDDASLRAVSESDRAKIISGLRLLDIIIFDRIFKIVMLVLALSSSGEVERISQIENVIYKLAEHQQNILSLQEKLLGHNEFLSTVTTDVYLRTGPSTSNDSICLLRLGTQFLVTKERDGWSAGMVYLSEENPVYGWVNSDFLVPLEAQQ